MKRTILLFAAIAFSVGYYAQTNSTNRKTSMRELNKYKNQNRQTNTVDNSLPDGIIRQNGNIMRVKNGERTIIDHTMSNEIKIMSDGTRIKQDGTKMLM